MEHFSLKHLDEILNLRQCSKELRHLRMLGWDEYIFACELEVILCDLDGGLR